MQYQHFFIEVQYNIMFYVIKPRKLRLFVDRTERALIFVCHRGQKAKEGDWDFRISDLVKNSDGTDIEPQWKISVKSGGLSWPNPLSSPPYWCTWDLSTSVQMLKREWGAESNGKLPHLSIPNKIAAWIPEFAVDDLPMSTTAAFIPDFAVKHLPLGRIL